MKRSEDKLVIFKTGDGKVTVDTRFDEDAEDTEDIG